MAQRFDGELHFPNNFRYANRAEFDVFPAVPEEVIDRLLASPHRIFIHPRAIDGGTRFTVAPTLAASQLAHQKPALLQSIHAAAEQQLIQRGAQST